MNPFIICYPSVKELFPAYHEDAQEWRVSATFYGDFKIAEKFGISAVKDTFRRAFGAWKNNAKYLTELCVACNHLCWFWNEKNEALSALYTEYYYKCYDLMFKTDEDGKNASPFTDEEVGMMYKVLD